MSVRRWLAITTFVLAGGLSAGSALGGGSGLNVVVVVNQASSNSLALGNYYCEQSHVPPQNVLRITWPGSNVGWSLAQFQDTLATPLQTMLATRGLTSQIEYVVLSMDIPYTVTSTDGVNSTTAALFYGFVPDTDSPDPNYPSCSLPPNSTSSYAFSEGNFRASAPPGALLTTMITADTLAAAQAIVDQGVASDGTFPTQAVYLAKSSDVLRNVRFVLFDNAVFDARLQGSPNLARIDSDSPAGFSNILGYQTGLANFSIAPNTFVPGAMADSMTSYGGMLFAASGQTSLLAFLGAGAAGSYGTVIEPCAYPQKFPSPLNYFYQGRGFSLAESYYLSLPNPYQGLIVAEPLAAPFAQPGTGTWQNLPAGATLAGTTNLIVQFAAAAPERPLQQVDLFIDGLLASTVTNLAPAAGNLISITTTGAPQTYVVQPNATLASIAADLANTLNAASATTHVAATAYGDRIELQGTDPGTLGSQLSVTATSLLGSASALTTLIRASSSNFLDTIAFAATYLEVSQPPAPGDWIQLDISNTNGTHTVLAVTNSMDGGTVSELVQNLVNLINGDSDLAAADGVIAEDFIGYDSDGIPDATFTIRARSPGIAASQIQANLTASPTLLVPASIPNPLNANLSDLQPRNHLYLTTGTTNPTCFVSLDTTSLADGWHELVAVAYEGSHVATQTRAAQTVFVQNSTLTAAIATSAASGFAAQNGSLQFVVTANSTTIAAIELFTNGGSLGVVSNQLAAVFSIPATNLGAGLLPFYAVVTDSNGRQYRTPTQFIRLIATPVITGVRAAQSSLLIDVTGLEIGQTYTVQTTTNLAATAWSNETSFVASQLTTTLTNDTTGVLSKFYRIGR